MANSLFKKRKRKNDKKTREAALIKKTTSSTSSDSEDESSLYQSILSTKRKRQLIQHLEMKRGVDASQLLTAAASTTTAITSALSHDSAKSHKKASTSATMDDPTKFPPNNADDVDEQRDGRRLQCSFNVTSQQHTNAGDIYDDNDDAGAGNYTMTRKHREAMEDYIQKKMTTSQNKTFSPRLTNPRLTDGNKKPTTSSDPFETLAAENARIVATVRHNSSHHHPAPTINNPPTKTTNAADDNPKDDDVGAGGAMLGGTGLAEVILPVEERIRSAKVTERLSMELYRKRRGTGCFYGDGRGRGDDDVDGSGEENLLPAQFGVGPGKRKFARQKTKIGTEEEEGEEGGRFAIRTTPAKVLNKNRHQSSHDEDSVLTGSYSQNFQQFSEIRYREMKGTAMKASMMEAKLKNKNPVAMTEESGGKMGFAAARKAALLAKAEGDAGGDSGGNDKTGREEHSSLSSSYDRANDERVWLNFMKRHRERTIKRG